MGEWKLRIPQWLETVRRGGRLVPGATQGHLAAKGEV